MRRPTSSSACPTGAAKPRKKGRRKTFALEEFYYERAWVDSCFKTYETVNQGPTPTSRREWAQELRTLRIENFRCSVVAPGHSWKLHGGNNYGWLVKVADE